MSKPLVLPGGANLSKTLSEASLGQLHAFVRATDANIRDRHRLAVGAQEHTDKLLTWLSPGALDRSRVGEGGWKSSGLWLRLGCV
jgi:hypothetical protein